MKFKIYILLLLLLPLLSCNTENHQIAQPIIKNAVLDISNWNFKKNGEIPLAGKWEFYWKQLINPQNFDSINRQNTKYFNMPDYWNDKVIDGVKLSNIGYATYRLHIFSNENQRLSMFIDEQMTAYKFWCNNKVVCESGKVATNEYEAVPKRKPLIVDVELKKGENEFVFQISNFHHRLGGFYLAPSLGISTQIYEAYEIKRAYEMFLIGILFIMGLYFLMLYILKSFLSGTFFLGIFAILLAIKAALNGSRFMEDLIPGLSWATQYRIEYLTIFISPTIMLYFLQKIYVKEISKIVAQISLWGSILFSITVFFPPIFFTKLLFLQYFLLLFVMVYLYWRIILATKNKREGAKTIAITLTVYVIAVINDMLYLPGYIKWSVELIPLGTFILVLGQALVLTKVFANLIKDHESLTHKLDYRNKNLDLMVKSKTKKLRMQQQSLLEKNEKLQNQNEKITYINNSLEEQTQRLEYSETKMRNLLQMLPEAIFEIDNNGNIIYANDEFYKYVNYKKTERLNINKLVNVKDENKTFLSIIKEKTTENKVIKNLNVNITKSDNAEFPALFSITKGTEDDELAFRCMFMDISTQVADENKIINAYQEISIKNKDITDSIQYAYTMQKAVMPTEEIYEKLFDGYFIINRPRNIVSGDFYYIHQIDNKVVFALSDCTGHGVPGGFMTMLGITLLNELYANNHQIISPDVALNTMRKKIIDSLDQDTDAYSNKDGMDMILCVLDTETLMLNVASANQPLLILRNGELTTIKVDSMPLGIYLRMNDFALKQVQLQKGDILYTFSDGIIDSFGGENGRKLHLKGLQEMIENCYTLPLKEQCKYIEDEFDKWQGTEKQIDDILMIGLKI